MLQRHGMGETGETYLVGADHLMRSDSYLAPDTHSVLASFKSKQSVKTTAIDAALAGKAGSGVIKDYNGNLVVSVWDQVDLGDGVKWAMLTEMDIAEAFNPVDDEGVSLYNKYVDKYGYYDLFLINPDGYIFFTAFEEPDYQTNILTGLYKDSNLGQLVGQVIQTKEYGMVDFAPYAPSNDAPAAFIAQPIVHNGKVLMVVALQLSLESINNIMQQREGMGESGESYLVGSDLLMRSDSFLDSAGHSVEASFAGSVANNGVDTLAARNAIAGKTGAEIIMDYTGNPVLSAYTPLKIGDTTWALIAEINEDEALAVVSSLQQMAIIIVLLAAATVTALGMYLAKSIANPIKEVARTADLVARGDLTVSIAVTQKDEVGILQKAMADMVDSLSITVNKIRESSLAQAAASQELAAITEQTGRNVTEQHEATDQVATAINEMSSTIHDVSQNTQNAATESKDAKTKVSDGMKVVEKTLAEAEKLSNQMNITMEKIQSLADSAANIGGILDVIKGIADQTNLLALNAAIEAARAGEQGRGFAVVADEVRSLAQSTQDSTGEIEGMIKKLQGEATESIDAMKIGVEDTESMQIQSKEIATSFQGISSSV